MLTVIGFSTFAVISILIAYNTKIAHDEAIESSKEHADALANDYAKQVEAEIEAALNSAHDLAYSLSAVKDEEFKLDIDRDECNNILRKVLAGNTTYYGTYCVWEPDAFDGKDDFYGELYYLDTIYPNMEGNDSFGHFVPYWFRYEDLLLQEPTFAYGNDWYEIPKRTKKEMVVDPTVYTVNGESVMLVTLEAPILHDNVFYGLTGVDISINWLQDRINEAQLYDGAARLSIISNDGTIAATSAHDTLPGRKYEAIFGLEQRQKRDLELGRAGSKMTDESLKVYAPIVIGLGETPWQVSIEIPSEIITANAEDQMYRSIYISLSLLLVILLSIFFFVNRLIKPLTAMVRVTDTMSKGVLDSKVKIERSNDEIGKMADALEHLAHGLRRTTNFANSIGQGDLNADYEALSDDDVLGNALLEMRTNLKSISVGDAERNWVTVGQAEFGEILRNNNDDLSQLCYNIIHHTINYLNANQGAVYVVNHETGNLEMAGAYAWKRQKFMQQEFEPGEGLAGQCLLERKSIYLEEIPEDYIRIRSGAGEASPRLILVVPLQLNDVIEGVIEVASFNPIPEYQIQFLESIGETIASTLSNVKSNEATKKLLEETKRTREEIQSSEEELRQNMEELQSTQEEMKRAQDEIKLKEQTLLALVNSSDDTYFAIDRDYNILAVNESVQQRMRQVGVEVNAGDYIFDKLNPDSHGMWKERYDRALGGESYVISEERDGPDGTKIYIDGYYRPIYDSKGNVFGCSVISRDVTKYHVAKLKAETLEAENEKLKKRG